MQPHFFGLIDRFSCSCETLCQCKVSINISRADKSPPTPGQSALQAGHRSFAMLTLRDYTHSIREPMSHLNLPNTKTQRSLLLLKLFLSCHKITYISIYKETDEGLRGKRAEGEVIGGTELFRDLMSTNQQELDTSVILVYNDWTQTTVDKRLSCPNRRTN